MKYKKGDVLMVKNGERVRIIILDTGSPEEIIPRCYKGPNNKKYIDRDLLNIRKDCNEKSLYLLSVLRGAHALNVSPNEDTVWGRRSLVEEAFTYDSEWLEEKLMGGEDEI